MDEVLESLHPLLISPLSTFHMCLQVTIQEQELVATEGEINTKWGFIGERIEPPNS